MDEGKRSKWERKVEHNEKGRWQAQLLLRLLFCPLVLHTKGHGGGGKVTCTALAAHAARKRLGKPRRKKEETGLEHFKAVSDLAKEKRTERAVD